MNESKLPALIKILNINANQADPELTDECLKMDTKSLVPNKHCSASNCRYCVFMSANSPNRSIAYEQVHEHISKLD